MRDRVGGGRAAAVEVACERLVERARGDPVAIRAEPAAEPEPVAAEAAPTGDYVPMSEWLDDLDE